MASDPRVEVTQLLIAYSGGDQQALDDLMPAVYEELRTLAHRSLRRERSDHTLKTTDLVHEAFLKLIDQNRVEWQNRNHFFAIAAQAMRRILINYAKMRKRLKRGGGAAKVSLDDAIVLSDERADELIALDEALERLEKVSERRARIVECRYFGGFNIQETADILGVSARTVKREWTVARAWLYRALSNTSSTD